MGSIVVGVDGSESARVAVEFAAEEAALRGAHLKVVMVLEVSERGQEPSRSVPEVLDKRQQIAEEVVRDAALHAKGLRPDLPCQGVVLHGRPQNVLVEEGRGADLLVVGRRGQGGLASLLMGSVSGYVVNNAPCPVAVVAPPAG